MTINNVYDMLRRKIESMGMSYMERDGIIRDTNAIREIGLLRLAITTIDIQETERRG